MPTGAHEAHERRPTPSIRCRPWAPEALLLGELLRLALLPQLALLGVGTFPLQELLLQKALLLLLALLRQHDPLLRLPPNASATQ